CATDYVYNYRFALASW
nr:immunoglobulin heavy chain junction region [Macaca mulatta]MOV50209.1 immunoglobulin heavy chain junction region [Macaca mulatta]MOV50466.1 immunoglobulin heavy chain junction region [Macaca mulatta]MOV50772.1 immunoglobulin heavy chain junction region [Macaca mulatta]MOV51030.1 immunoglobulin heavy chain junction region [Macaca mulatta]